MALWTPDHLRVKGAKTSFHQAMETVDSVWENHVQKVTSETNVESYNFPGFIPVPREFLDSRSFQGMRDFTFDVENNEYELSMIVNRKHFEDDQTGLINARFAEMGEAWATYKDKQFADLLAAGNVSGSNGFDGATFHNASRTIGDSGTIDNINATNISDTAAATAAEALTIINNAKIQFFGFNDDQGRPMATQALKTLRVICTPGHERGFLEGVNSTLIGGGNSNPWGQNIAEIDILPYLSTGAEIYISALGASTRRPFIYQERTPLELIVKAGADDVAENNGVLVLTRQRYVFAYGEPRFSVIDIVT